MSEKDKFDFEGEDQSTYRPRTGKKTVSRPTGETRKSVEKHSPKFERKPKEKKEGGSFKKKSASKPFEQKKEEGFKKEFNPQSGGKKGFIAKKKEQKEQKELGLNRKEIRPKHEDAENSKKKSFAPKKNPKNRKKKSSGNVPEYDFSKVNRFKKGAKDAKGKSDVEHGEIRLNRYISNAGVCSRREADELIKNGEVKVNGKVVTELGTKVNRSDKVEYRGELLSREKKVYVLLNKPKNHLTTMDDPQGRRTVMDLVGHACEERIYPVGRLDRNTTGLLLFTNDGELATALSHPSSNVKKVYRIELNKDIDPKHFEAIAKGIELEDGFIKPDSIAVNEVDFRIVGVEIHSGKNRIVRRIFEHFGYTVERLDRTAYAGLTKKDLPRGKWRFLTQGELIRLKHFEKFK